MYTIVASSYATTVVAKNLLRVGVRVMLVRTSTDSSPGLVLEIMNHCDGGPLGGSENIDMKSKRCLLVVHHHNGSSVAVWKLFAGKTILFPQD